MALVGKNKSAKPICVVPEPDWIPDGCLELLSKQFEILEGPYNREELKIALKSAVGAFVGLDHYFDASVLSETIRFIASPTTGLNHIDMAYAQQSGITVLSLKGETEFLKTIPATAELCWGLLLALRRNILPAAASVVNGEWDRDRWRSHDLKGSTLGIIGYGRIGRLMARYGSAFGMRVLACDVRDVDISGAESCSIDAVLEQSDIVSLHVNSNPQNREMINAVSFRKMKKEALFINTARGDLVNEADLLEALQTGIIAGAALDVLQEEFETGAASTLLKNFAKENYNLLLTPHIGGVTVESQYRTTHFVVAKVAEWWEAHDDC